MTKNDKKKRRNKRPKINRKQAERFLRFLDQESDGHSFQTFDDNRERDDPALRHVFHGSFKKRFNELVRLNRKGAAVCVMINEGDGRGRQADNVISVRAVFLDLDDAPLDPVGDHQLTPHVIVESSPGRFHCYWRVKDFPKEWFSEIQKAIAYQFGGDPSVNDLARVMRLPGFYHRKAKPFRTKIVEKYDEI